MICLVLLFISIISESKDINIINLYLFTLDLSKIPILNSIDKILLFLSSYFFIVYYSFLINDKDIIKELNDSISFDVLYKIVKSNRNVSFKKFMFFLFYPIIFIFDSLVSKNFAIYFSPILFFYIIIHMYLYNLSKNINQYVYVFTLAVFMIFMYELWKLLIFKSKSKFKKLDNNFFNKYSENKKIYLNRKKIYRDEI